MIQTLINPIHCHYNTIVHNQCRFYLPGEDYTTNHEMQNTSLIGRRKNNWM